MKIMKSIIFILISFIFLSVFNVRAQGATQTLGGVETEGTLRISIYDDGNMAVHRYSNGYWQQQWYGGNHKSTLCYINGTDYAVEGSYYNSGATSLTTSSNTSSTDTAELVLEKSDVVSIKQTTYYPPGAVYFTLQWEITNLSDATVNDLRFFSGGDTYLSGGDNGAGFWQPTENIVGVKKMLTETSQQNMYIQGNTIPYAYESRYYWDVRNSVVANALTDAIDPNEGTDNGMAMEWRKESLAVGATWTIHATEKFITKEVSGLLVSAPIFSQIAPGSSIDLTYSVTNLTDSETSVALNETIDLGEWTAVIQSPSSPFTLAGSASQDVVILVTCPEGTELGTVSKVTLEATNPSGSASDFCNVEAAQVPTITLQPSDCSVDAGESASFTISADNATSYQWQEFTVSWRNVIDEGIYSGATSITLNISSAAAGMNGYKYRCVATNGYGNATSNTSTLTVTTSPGTFDYPLPGGTGLPTDYRIFTVPLSMTGAEMLAEMEGVLGAYSPGLWRVFAYVASNYLEINSVSFASLDIVPGMGFWIIAMLNDVVTFRGSIAPGGVNYEMSIPSGWNLMALPWTSTNIDLGNIQVTDGVNAYGITSVDNNLTQRCAWHYTGNGPYNGYEKLDTSTNTLLCGTGYFIKVLTAGSVTVIFPPVNAAGVRIEKGSTGNEETPPPPPGRYPPYSCPDISQGRLENVTFPSNADCQYTYRGTLTIGKGLTMEKGAVVTIRADKVIIESLFDAKEGAVVKIRQ